MHKPTGEDRFRYIDDLLPEHQIDIVVGDFHAVIASPYGKSWKMFDKCYVRTVQERDFHGISLPLASCDINRFEKDGVVDYSVHAHLDNCTTFERIDTFEAALAMAIEVCWQHVNGYILSADYHKRSEAIYNKNQQQTT